MNHPQCAPACNGVCDPSRRCAGLLNPAEWPLQTPHGPMVHIETSESYQARNARLEQEGAK